MKLPNHKQQVMLYHASDIASSLTSQHVSKMLLCRARLLMLIKARSSSVCRAGRHQRLLQQMVCDTGTAARCSKRHGTAGAPFVDSSD